MITGQDKKDMIRVSEIIRKIDKIDGTYFSNESDIVFRQQPFLLSLILGYQLDFKPNEMDELIKLIFIIWDYFKDKSNVNNKQITDSQFERVQKRNIHLLEYLGGADSVQEESEIIASDLSHLRSKALLTGIIFRLNNQDAFKKMNQKSKEILMIGMKCLIECFEEIVRE